METFVVTSILHQLGNKPWTSEETYYENFEARRPRTFPIVSIAILFVGAILALGLPL